MKVLHPGLVDVVSTDMDLLRLMGRAIDRQYPYFSVGDALASFEKIMLSQTDLALEARNLRTLRLNFEGDDTVTFPEPVLEHPHVLVEEFVHGVPILQAVGTPDP